MLTFAGAGQIDYEEFIAAMLDSKKVARRRDAVRAVLAVARCTGCRRAAGCCWQAQRLYFQASSCRGVERQRRGLMVASPCARDLNKPSSSPVPLSCCLPARLALTKT